MNALIRAAIAGAVVGLAEAAAYGLALEDELLAVVALLYGPFPLGMLLCRLGRLPHWGVVAALGPFGAVAFFVGAHSHLSFSTIMEFGEWRGGLILMAIGACSYAFAAGLVMPMHRAVRVSVLGVIAAAYIAAWSTQDVIALAARTQVMARAGVPVIAPDLPGYRLTRADGEDTSLFLSYERQRDHSDLIISIEPKSETTLELACEVGIADSVLDDYTPTCRKVSAGIWIRTETIRTTVLTTHGNALVEVGSDTASEAELLAVLPTFRPIGAWELAHS